MSSPVPVEPPASQDIWPMDPTTDESNNVHLTDAHDNIVHHENGDTGNADSAEDSGPLLPSKTAGGPDLGVPGAKPGTIYREKQIKVLRTFSSLPPWLSCVLFFVLLF